MNVRLGSKGDLTAPKLERAQWSTLMREHRMNSLRVFVLAHISTGLVEVGRLSRSNGASVVRKETQMTQVS